MIEVCLELRFWCVSAPFSASHFSLEKCRNDAIIADFGFKPEEVLQVHILGAASTCTHVHLLPTTAGFVVSRPSSQSKLKLPRSSRSRCVQDGESIFKLRTCGSGSPSRSSSSPPRSLPSVASPRAGAPASRTYLRKKATVRLSLSLSLSLL